MALLGIDVSEHQPPIHWPAVARHGVRFAMCRASWGNADQDQSYRAHRDAARDAGVATGSYHYAYPRNRDARIEARNFADQLDGLDELPPTLDIEEVTHGLGPVAVARWAIEFCEEIEQRANTTPVIYLSPSYIGATMAPEPDLARFGLWIAHWGVSAPRVPPPWSNWLLWQTHVGAPGSVPGIPGRIDMNLGRDKLLAPPGPGENLAQWKFGTPGDRRVFLSLDGTDVIVVAREKPDGITFFEDRFPFGGRARRMASYGQAGDVPVAGRWGRGGDLGLAVFRPATGELHVRRRFSGGVADSTVQTGLSGPVNLEAVPFPGERDVIAVTSPDGVTVELYDPET